MRLQNLILHSRISFRLISTIPDSASRRRGFPLSSSSGYAFIGTLKAPSGLLCTAGEKRAKVLLTRAWTRLVASIPTVVDNVADFVEGDAVPIGALKLALPAGKHRRRRENAGANEPMHVCNTVKSDRFQYQGEKVRH